MKRLTTTFKEVPVKNYSLVNKFANECSVNGVPYPQGTGKTKKEAKTQAAKIAFNIILGFESYEDYGEGGFFHNIDNTESLRCCILLILRLHLMTFAITCSTSVFKLAIVEHIVL